MSSTATGQARLAPATAAAETARPAIRRRQPPGAATIQTRAKTGRRASLQELRHEAEADERPRQASQRTRPASRARSSAHAAETRRRVGGVGIVVAEDQDAAGVSAITTPAIVARGRSEERRPRGRGSPRRHAHQAWGRGSSTRRGRRCGPRAPSPRGEGRLVDRNEAGGVERAEETGRPALRGRLGGHRVVGVGVAADREVHEIEDRGEASHAPSAGRAQASARSRSRSAPEAAAIVAIPASGPRPVRRWVG